MSEPEQDEPTVWDVAWREGYAKALKTVLGVSDQQAFSMARGFWRPPRTWRTRLARWLLLALAVLLAAGCSIPDPTAPRPPPHAEPPPATTTLPGNGCGGREPLAGCASVVRVVDGDTIVVAIDPALEGTTVRLVGIDTPETVHPHKPPGCYGEQAHQATQRLAPPGTRLRLETDREPRDRYGRTLAYAWLPSGRMLNAELVWSGYARVLVIKPNVAHAKEFARLQADAKAHRRGLWAACYPATSTTKGP